MSVVNMFAYFRPDGDLYWALQGATRVLVEYGRDCLLLLGQGQQESQGSRSSPGMHQGETQLVLTPAWQ